MQAGQNCGAVSLKAFAKINLGLDVTGARPDGYHELRSVMQSVSLHDIVTLKRKDICGVTLASDLKYLPSGEKNIAYRAARMLCDEFDLKEGVHITLQKRIPVSAGLGGGSADAAAALIGMNTLFSLGLSTEALTARGLRLGADVPFCIMRGTMLAEGIGEKLTRVPSALKCRILIAKPQVSVSTKEVYAALDLNPRAVRPDTRKLIEGLKKGDLKAVGAAMGNVLESVTVPKYPVIQKIKDIMKEEGAVGAAMSGSGPSVFGLFAESASAKRAAERIQRQTGVNRLYFTRACGAEENIGIKM